MSTQIYRDDAMVATEVFKLRCQVRMVSAPAVHQQQGRCAAPGLRVRKRHAITCESLHNTPPADLHCVARAGVVQAGAEAWRESDEMTLRTVGPDER